MLLNEARLSDRLLCSMKIKAWFLLVATLLLGACSSTTPRAVIETGPSINLSNNWSLLGLPVGVNLSAKFYGGDREQNLGERILSVCFRTLTTEMIGGTCREGKVPLPESLQIINDTSLEKDMGEVVVSANGVVELKHYLAFTSTEPRIVRVTAFIGHVNDDGQTVYTTEDQSDVVDFVPEGIDPGPSQP